MRIDDCGTGRFEQGHDLVVISDVHLHEGTPGSTVQALVRLFNRLAEEKSPEHPRFRVVLAGDFFDFPLVASMPSPGEVGFEVSERERRFGLEATGEKTAWKIHCLSRRHPELFTAMARFIENGNEMVFIPGNHDEELLLPEVQTHLQRLLGKGPEAGDSDDVDPCRGSVRFTPWFYHEPGFIFVEHGHFYDNDNVPLTPLRPCPLPANARIHHPLGSLVTRYLLTLLKGYDFQGDSDQTPWPLLVKVIRSCGVRAPLTIYRYYVMAARVLRMTGAKMRSRLAQGGTSLEEAAEGLRVKSRHLKKLLCLTAEPTTNSFRKTMGRLYLDRSAAFAFFLITVLFVMMQLVRGGTSGLWLPLVALGVLLFTMRSGNLFGNKTGPVCREAAAKIQEILDTPCVVMGHAHRAEKLQMTAPDGRAWTYVNTGSFSEPGPGRGDECPYLMVRRGRGHNNPLTTGSIDLHGHANT